MNEKIPLSVVVITKNEERNIKDCIESVKDASEVIVLDDNSSDKTVEIAESFGAKVSTRERTETMLILWLPTNGS